MALELNDQNFDQEIKNFEGVALVDFWASWCMPCKMQGPIIDQLAEELKDKSNIKITKLNVEENPAKSQEFEIMSIPSLKIFKNGKVVEDMVGVQSKNVLLEKINKNL
ncbi:MAG: thioredoxin 1 [Patescibacteria group bacterium]|nr:thioredoxin 1 [Patescibacteria group bacterium]